MAHIEIDTNDLTLLSNDINEMNAKIDNLKSIINTKYDKVKELNFYLNGFKNISNYLESQVTKMNGVKAKLEKYQNNIINIEKSYSEKFNDIAVPSFQSNSDNLVAVSPVTTVSPVAETTPATVAETTPATVAATVPETAPKSNTSNSVVTTTPNINSNNQNTNNVTNQQTVTKTENNESDKESSNTGCDAASD